MKKNLTAEFDDSDDSLYLKVSTFIHENAGIFLGPQKINMMKARLSRRFSETGHNSISSYLKHIEGPDGKSEVPHLISALTTNFTNFFREPHHFELLSKIIIPEISSARKGDIRIWSAGCSSGQEPLSISMSVAESHREAFSRLKITATDIDQAILEKAMSGRYSVSDLANIPNQLRLKYFLTHDAETQAKEEVLSTISYKELNLNGRWHFHNKFDVIFCRNVAIYFDQDTQNTLWKKFESMLSDSGFLIIGHSERLPDNLRDKFTPVGPTSYRKK